MTTTTTSDQAGAAPDAMTATDEVQVPVLKPERMRQQNPDDVIRVVLAAIGFGVMTTLAIIGANVDPFERNLFRIVNELPDAIEPMVWVVMQLGSFAAIVVVVALALLARRPKLGRDLAVSGLVAYGIARVAKELIVRPRPGELLLEVVQRGSHIGLGYPSGHAAVAAALATVLAPHLPRIARRWLWVSVWVVGIGRLFVGAHLPLDVVGGWLLGWLVGSALLLIVGSPVGTPDLVRVRRQLCDAGLAVDTIEELAADARGSTPLVLTMDSGETMFGKVLTSQNRSADMLFKLLRRVMYRSIEDETPFVTSKQQAEHEVLLTMLAREAGVRVAPYVHVVADSSDKAVLVEASIDGTGLDEIVGDGVSDELLSDLLSQVALLHEARIAHRDLRPANVMVGPEGEAWLVDFGFAQTSASVRRRAWDIAELIAGLAPDVELDRLVPAAKIAFGEEMLAEALVMMTPSAFSSVTRERIKEQDGLLDELREAVADAAGIGDVEEVDTETMLRVRPRTVAIVAVLGLGLYALLPQMGQIPEAWDALRTANPLLLAAAVLASMATYVAAGMSLVGASPANLPLPRATVGALAGSFASRLAPGGLGRVGLDVRLMTQAGATRAEAVAGETVLAVSGGLVHAVALVLLGLGYGRDLAGNALPEGGPLLLGAAVVVALLGVVSTQTEKGRELLGHVKEGLAAAREAATDPVRVTQLLVGAVLLNTMYILALDMAVRAVGGEVGPGAVALVYMGGSIFAAVSPTPGGLGAVEAALVAGLTVVGVGTPQAVAGVLLFRLLTYWLPTLPGWFAFRALRNRGHL